MDLADNRFIEGTLYPKGEAPSTVMPTIVKIGQAVLCLAVAAPISGMMPIPWMCTDDYYVHGFAFKYVAPSRRAPPKTNKSELRVIFLEAG